MNSLSQTEQFVSVLKENPNKKFKTDELAKAVVIKYECNEDGTSTNKHALVKASVDKIKKLQHNLYPCIKQMQKLDSNIVYDTSANPHLLYCESPAMTIDNFLECIKSNSDKVEGYDWWRVGEMAKSIPNWRELVKNPKNWDKLDSIVLNNDTVNCLCENIIEEVGFNLFEKWKTSSITKQEKAALNWACDNTEYWDDFSLDIKTKLIKQKDIDDFLHVIDDDWNNFSDSIKRHIIGKAFKNVEQFECVDEYNRLVFRFLEHNCYERHHHQINFQNELSSYTPIIYNGFETSYIIDSLLMIIEDAGDKKYLDYVNKMIKKRDIVATKLYSDSSSVNNKRIVYTPNANEDELIARLLGKFINNGYFPYSKPQIFISTETPPILTAYPELKKEVEYWKQIKRDREIDEINRESRQYLDYHELPNDKNTISQDRERCISEKVPITEVLGVYFSGTGEIVLYQDIIDMHSAKHGWDKDWLISVVLIHEYSHWITHKLEKENIPTWDTKLFNLTDTFVKEGWAQLLTYWIANEIGGEFKRVFEELNNRQSMKYKEFKNYIQYDIGSVVKSLEVLRLLPYPTGLSNWVNSIK